MPSIIQADQLKSADGVTTYLNSGTLSNITFPDGHVTRTDHAFEASSNWIETTSTSWQPSGIIVNAGTVSTGESIILNCTIRNASPFEANLSASYYHKIGTGGTYADLLTNGGSAGGSRFFLQHYTNYPLQPFTMYFAHTSPSTSDDNFYQIYFRSLSSGNKARLAWFGSGIEITTQRVKFNSSTDLSL